mgnify:CR=1 FL=1
MKKILLTFALLFALALRAWAEDVDYLYYRVIDLGYEASIYKNNGTASNPTVLTSTLLENSNEDNLDTGWYVLNSTFSYAERIVISGDVKLILKDGCTLTAEQGIRINTDATLTIYAQSEDEATMGKIIATETHHDKAAIGGNKNFVAGRLFIHGGNIEANCTDGSKYAAGIGGGYGDGSGMKEINIYGGKVDATGAKYGAGIGGGKNNNHPGTINIYGGTVNAKGGENGAGIGGGENRDGWNTNVYGGNITAKGGIFYGAGIGGGSHGKGGNLHFYGGTVIAQGGASGAGIGGGDQSEGGNLHFHGGTVNARGGANAAGIGGGMDADGGTIIIDGGNITGSGNTGGAGIGGGNLGSAGTITINGGTVTAESNGYETYEYYEYTHFGYRIPPMMGYGADSKKKDGTVTIENGATVHLRTVNGYEENAIGIGCATLNLGSNMRVWAMMDAYRLFHASTVQRVNTCMMESRSVDIKTCTPHSLEYTVTAENHTASCKYCAFTSIEAHSLAPSGTTCAVCGYGMEADLCSVIRNTPTADGTDYMNTNITLVKGADYSLPTCDYNVTDMEFAGWQVGGSKPATAEATDGEALYEPGHTISVTESTDIYARYRYVFTESWQWWIGADGDKVAVTVKNGNGPQLIYATVTSETVEATETTPGYTVYTATATYKPNGYTYTFTDRQAVVDFATVELGEDDNTTTLADNDGAVANVTLSGRTLYKNDNWNTLCLPFDVALEGSPLEGATVKEFTDATYNTETGMLTLSFSDATSIKAGQAYLVKWDSGTNLSPSDLVFTGVKLSQNLRTDEITTSEEAAATITFVGTYKKLTFDDEDRTVLFFGENNTLYYPQSGATIGAQRAYFQLSGLTAGASADAAVNVRGFSLDFGEDGTSTGIIEVETPFTPHALQEDGWYTIDGRRLSGKPTARGIYINNGMKIVIK